MKKLTLAQGILTVAQILLCGFSIAFLFSLVARMLFVGKLIGMRVTITTLLVLEITGVGLKLFLPLLFKMHMDWSEIIITVIIAVLSSLIMWFDDFFYIYFDNEIEQIKQEEKLAG